MADDLDAVDFDDFTRLGALDIAAALDREIDDHRTGAHRLLWIGSLGLVPLAGGWVLSSNYIWLMTLQLVAGAAWGAYELALVLLFFETIHESERTSLLTLYNVANSIALALGSLIGAAIINGLGISAASYLWVFAASTAFRALALLLLRRVRATPAETVAANRSASPLSAGQAS